jgi:hypothetical protein
LLAARDACEWYAVSGRAARAARSERRALGEMVKQRRGRRPQADEAPRPRGFARTLKALLQYRHLGDRAREWAEATLLAAGLPNEVDFYSLGPDGCLVRARDDLTPEEQDGIVAAGGTGIISLRSSRKLAAAVPWVASLPSAVGRIGYAPGTPERDAAELLELLLTSPTTSMKATRARSPISRSTRACCGKPGATTMTRRPVAGSGASVAGAQNSPRMMKPTFDGSLKTRS